MNEYLVEVYTLDYAPCFDHYLNASSMDQAQLAAEVWMAANGWPLHRFQCVIEQTSGIREPFPFPL